MRDTFNKILNQNPSELEYLKLLLESDFPSLLADKIASFGYGPRLVQLNISYIDKSPRLKPVNSWPFTSGVEFGDLMFAIRYEYLQQRNKNASIEIKKDENRSIAFVFQSKVKEKESGESTKKQEHLYRKWPSFNVSVPHEVRDNCNNPSNLFEQSDKEGKSIKKSGLWIINSSTPPIPEIIVRDSADKNKDLKLNLDDFFLELMSHKYEVGKRFNDKAKDDWSRLVCAILNYTKKKKLRRTSAANPKYKNVSHSMRTDFSRLGNLYYDFNESDIKTDEKSFSFLSFLKKIFCLSTKRFWIVEINITDVEFRFDS